MQRWALPTRNTFRRKRSSIMEDSIRFDVYCNFSWLNINQNACPPAATVLIFDVMLLPFCVFSIVMYSSKYLPSCLAVTVGAGRVVCGW